MPILFAWRALIVSETFQNSLFLPNMSFKISNIAVKCYRSLFYSRTFYLTGDMTNLYQFSVNVSLWILGEFPLKNCPRPIPRDQIPLW